MMSAMSTVTNQALMELRQMAIGQLYGWRQLDIPAVNGGVTDIYQQASGQPTPYAAARFAAIGAGVAWYGRLAPASDATPVQISSGQPWPVDIADNLKAPVLGLYGGKDQGIPLASVERMREALARAGQTGSQIVVYPDAQHGFHADYRTSYSEADAKDGWSKLLATFDKALKN